MKDELNRFLALDCATTNTGFALFQGKQLVEYGKLFFEGNTEYEKAMDAARVVFSYLTQNPVGAIVLESSFLGTNPKIATNLAISHGAVLGGAALAGVTSVASVVPIQWQQGIGNPRLTKEEKNAILEEYPDRSASWHAKARRVVRKERTIAIVQNKFGITTRDNDVADAIGIGLFVSENKDRVSW